MSIVITELELLNMPEDLLRDLRTYLKEQRTSEKLVPENTQNVSIAPYENIGNSDVSSIRNSEVWEFAEHNIRISEITRKDELNGLPKGIEIQQGSEEGESHHYIANKWLLSEELRNVLDTAFKYGFTKLWREGHPRHAFLDGNSKYKSGVKHISFSRSHHEKWTFAIDIDNSRAPDIKVIVVEKSLFEDLMKLFIEKTSPGKSLSPGEWFQEKGGGQNYKIHPSDLETLLREITQ